MAKKKPNKLQAFLSDERFKFTIGVSIIGVSIILLFSFFSYLFTWKVDQSFQWEPVFSGASVQVENWIGKIGASLSFTFIGKWFGIASFAFPFVFLIVGLKLFNIELLKIGPTIKVSFSGVLLASVVFSFIFGDSNGLLGNGLGGGYGYFISVWLTAFMGKIGTGIFLVLLIIVYTIFSFKASYNYFKNLFLRVINKIYYKSNAESKSNAEPNAEQDDATKEENKEEPNEDKTETLPSIFNETTNNQEQNPTVPNLTQITDHENNTNEPIDDSNSDDDIELSVETKKEEEYVTNISNDNLDIPYDPTLDLSNYKFPSISFLADHHVENSEVSKSELQNNKNRIVETLGNYGIKIDKVHATVGPTVTLYEIVPAPGVRISKIKNLEDDIALSLAALGIRIIAPIPGKGTIGIEVPNQHPEVVSMKSVISAAKFQETKFDLPMALGKTISNETFIADLTKMPHLLMAGATGQGKSVGLNAILTSLLYKKHPAQLKFVLIDPKKVELTLYSHIERHYLAKLPDTDEAIITDTQKVINTLNSLCVEMDKRYDLLKAAQVRNIKEYNAKFKDRKLNPNNGHRFLPYIVVVIDEFADLIMTAGREIESPIARLAQLARAIGIHLIIATQRPSTNIITGIIKANFPARIAFRVSSMIDSRTILDSPGANQLIGRGDMLISNGSDLIRLQCAFVDTPEIEEITTFIGKQQSYPSALLLPEVSNDSDAEPGAVDLSQRDSLFDEAARVVVINQQGSTSLIQRKFSIGYNRAGRIIDQLEAAGIVGPFEGSKARQVLVPDEFSLEQILNSL